MKVNIPSYKKIILTAFFLFISLERVSSNLLRGCAADAVEASAWGVRRPIEKSCASLRSRGADKSTGAEWEACEACEAREACACDGEGSGCGVEAGEGATRWCAGGGAGVERREPESLDASSRAPPCPAPGDDSRACNFARSVSTSIAICLF